MMALHSGRYLFLLLFCFLLSKLVSSQIIDTIANWDGINVTWGISASGSQNVSNPDQAGINPSENCLEVTTSINAYDLIFTDFAAPVNFTQYPVYRLKILAPESGGNVLLKFENSDNSSWVEIEKTPLPGQWDDLEFDFSGTTATDYSRLVIFFDFLGTAPDFEWYVDDVIRVQNNSADLTSNLPIIIINTDGVEIPDEPKITAYMGIIDNGPGNLNSQFDPPNDYDGMIGIEIRGQSSQMFPKKSYGIETRDELGANLNVPLLGMPAENDWVLYAPYSDKSMLRNFISFYMGSKLDQYCTRMSYCEVIINDDYKGVYILMEKIKKNENRVNIATLLEGDISGDELTGGYIIKVDKVDSDFIYGTDGWKSSPWPTYPNAMDIIFQYYYPKADDLVEEQSAYIKDYITDAENALISPVYSNPDIGYNYYFNTGSFVDQMLLNEVSKEVDKYRYSTYFHKEKESDGGKLFAGPPWDFNLGYSNVDYWAPGNEYSGWLYSLVSPVEWSIMFWWKRLMEDVYFRNLAKTRWSGLRLNEFSDDNLEYAIDSIVEYIDEAQQRNYERWPILGEYVWPNYDWEGNDYSDEVEFFETWLFNRIDWIDDNLPGTILSPSAALSGSFPDYEISLSDDYFSRLFLKKKYFTLNNASSELTIDTVVYLNASQASIKLSGIVPEPVEISVTMETKILNSYEDLTSSTIVAGLEDHIYSDHEVLIYTSRNVLYFECNHPELLGNRLEMYNLAGQRVETCRIEKKKLNEVHVNLLPGIYICRFLLDGKNQTKRVIF